MNKKILTWSFVLLSHFANSQSCLPEGIEFFSQMQIDSFQVNYPGCTQIEGDVSIGRSSDITNLDGLGVLTFIGGDLNIRSNPLLEDVTGLQNLYASSITDLLIIDNPCLTDCNVQSLCNYLASPNGIVTIFNNGVGCSSPPDIANTCNMQMPCLPFGNYYFTTQGEIDSFSDDYPSCSHLNSFVNICGNYINNLSGLGDITCIDGTFSVSDNNALYSLEGLDNLDSITEHLYISYNESLNSLAGLENLSFIGGSLVACFNPVLTSLEGLEGLDSVSGNIDIRDNENLTTVNGMNTISTIKCHLLIENNPELKSLNGIENLNSIGLRLIISGNSLLSICEVKSVCNYLSNPNGLAIIENNAIGCNSPGEVLEACSVGVGQLDGWAVGQLDITVYPNPAQGIVEFRFSNFDFRCGRVMLEILDVNGRERAVVFDGSKPAGEFTVQFDTSVLEPGIYFYRLTADGLTASGKLIVMR